MSENSSSLLSSDDAPSPLSVLSPLAKPDCARLLSDVKISLNRASASGVDLWSRLERNHNSRFCTWLGQDPTCRKVLRPGEKPPLPWENAADLRVRLVDSVIRDATDLLNLAESRVVPRLLPAMPVAPAGGRSAAGGMEEEGDSVMVKAEAWGSVLEYYGELAEENLCDAKAQWCDIGWEYGHGITYAGWTEERQLQKKTLTQEQAAQIVAAVSIGELESLGLLDENMGEAELSAVIDAAVQQAHAAIMDPAGKRTVMDALKTVDPGISPREAARVATKLRGGREVVYYVPVIVRACPELRALTPGLDVFYPYETENIQKAAWIVMPEWWTDVEMRANVTTRGWDRAAVEQVIANAPAGRAAFFTDTSAPYASCSWLLTGGVVGLGVRSYDFTGERNARVWQLLTVFYRATDPDTGVPVLYRTTFHPAMIDAANGHKAVSHVCSADAHARYPFIGYKREKGAQSLWASRGVGELSVSEQEELRHQANHCFDNATIAIRPPYEVSSRSEVGKMGLGPGVRVVTSSSFSAAGGVRKIDIAGDPRWSIEVQNQALARCNDYYKRGNAPEMDPIARQTAQQARVNEWVLSVKQCMKMVFQTIQQHCPEQIRASAVNGRAVNLDVSRAEIQGDFSLLMEFDVATLDPKSIEARAKMVREMVAPLDREGLLQTEPLLRMLMMSINPSWGRLIVNTSGAARKQQTDEAIRELMRALNGIEPEYLKGGNPKLRAEVILGILNTPAMGTDGKPIVNEQTGTPMPGAAASITRMVPGVAAFVENLLKHEAFEAEQQENVEVGKTGVKRLQSNGQ